MHQFQTVYPYHNLPLNGYDFFFYLFIPKWFFLQLQKAQHEGLLQSKVQQPPPPGSTSSGAVGGLLMDSELSVAHVVCLLSCRYILIAQIKTPTPPCIFINPRDLRSNPHGLLVDSDDAQVFFFFLFCVRVAQTRRALGEGDCKWSPELTLFCLGGYLSSI